MSFYVELYYIQSIALKSIFNCGGNVLGDFEFVFSFF